ncbi:hypothetical protein V1511DRAFT_503977 [Dipodascopsis uninucleata]
MPNILITGAAGLVGQLMTEELLSKEGYKLTLVDIVETPIPKKAKYPENATCIKADLVKDAKALVTKDLDAMFVFHGIMSAGSEANFELGMAVNLDSTRAILEAVRLQRPGLRIVYASSQAVFGQPFPEVTDESVVALPQSSYGAEKLVCETLINDYNRRGFIDAFALRFPTICVRPGKPTQALSSFVSGIIREPMTGIPCEVPVADPSFISWICSPRTLVTNLLIALELPSDAAPPHIRAVNLPGIGVTVQDQLDALRAVAGESAVELVTLNERPEVKKILDTWPPKFDNSLAYKMGFKPDQPFIDTVRDFKAILESS